MLAVPVSAPLLVPAATASLLARADDTRRPAFRPKAGPAATAGPRSARAAGTRGGGGRGGGGPPGGRGAGGGGGGGPGGGPPPRGPRGRTARPAASCRPARAAAGWRATCTLIRCTRTVR